MRHSFLIICLLWGGSAVAQSMETVGNIRVQALAPGLVRIEQRGPNGFEDRATFHVVGRSWPGVRLQRSEANGFVELKAERFSVRLPASAAGLGEVVVSDGSGNEIYRPGPLSNSEWLPAPGRMPKAWAFADMPRLIPPPWGLAAPPRGSDRPDTSGWDVSNDAPDVYVFIPGDYKSLRADFLRLTGPTELPPRYALGFMDSRYYAYSEESALRRIDEYRRRGFPLDLLVIDTDWRIGASHGYAPNPKLFPNMPRFLAAAKAKQVKIMFNDHPEPQSKSALDPKELTYRAEGLATLLNQGVDVWWYDRNWMVRLVEPALNLRREAWGMKLYRDITLQTRPISRPLIMANVDGIDNGVRNRPPNVATHRYPIQWTGDTLGQWKYLQNGVENAVFSGVRALNPYLSEDLGGHASQPSTELYIRFLEYGALSPVMRVHCTKGLTREPWAFGPLAEQIGRDYIKLRYRLMPLLYASAYQAWRQGEPVVRRLDLDYPQYDEAARDDQYLLGNQLLVAPIVTSAFESALPADLLRAPDGWPGLKGQYWDNPNLNGKPALERRDLKVEFDWGQGNPSTGLPNDGFSVRWTGRIGPLPTGSAFRLTSTSDDGVRIWLDGKVVIDAWKPLDSVTNVSSIRLEAGRTYDIKIEYFEQSGNAVCRLGLLKDDRNATASRSVWIPPGTWTDLWTGARYSGPTKVAVPAPIERIPMFAKAGSIVPLAPEMAYSWQKPWDTLTLEMFPGARNQEATTTIVEDDGESLAYQRGETRQTTITSFTQTASRSIVIRIGGSNGTYPRANSQRAWRVRVRVPAGWPSKSVRATLDSKSIKAVLRARGSTARMPLLGVGAALDGPLIELLVPPTPVGKAREIRVDFAPK